MKLKSLRSKVSKRGQPETFEVILQLHTATGLVSDLNGAFVFWAWKRGQHSGTTLKTSVGSGNKAVWDDSSVNVQCSMFPKRVGEYESKELELALKENESSRKIKKKTVGKATIELAQYAASCGESEFSTHFLKFDLLDDAKKCSAKVTATLKIRRDPTGSLYGTSRLSTTSHSSIGRYESDSDDSFQASDDEKDAAKKADDDGNDAAAADDDDDESVSASAPKTPAPAPGVAAAAAAAAAEEKAPKSPSKINVDKELAAFRPPPRLQRTTSSDLRMSVKSESLESDGEQALSPRSAAMNLVSTAKLARRASVDSRRALRQPRSIEPSDDERDTSPGTAEAESPPTTGSSPAMSIVAPVPSISIASSPPGGDAAQQYGRALTRMESLRANNSRKYGQRRRNDGELAEATLAVPHQSTSPRAQQSAPNSPPTLVKGAVSDGNLLIPSSSHSSAATSNNLLLREKDAELERLKQQLAQQQREDDRRFFVEETIVFMEPAFGDDGLPVAAYVIFRTMLQWDAFDGKNARFVSSVLDAFDKVLKRNAQNRDVLLYALATCMAVSHLLRTDPQSADVPRSAAAVVADVSGSVGNASDVDPDGGGSVSSSPAVNRYGGSVAPLNSFLEQLADIAHSFFSRCVELLLSQTDTLLVPAVLEGDMNNPERNAAPKQRLAQVLKDWHHSAIHAHHLPAEAVQQLYYAVFDELGARLLNALLERRDLCSCGNGLLTKMNVSALEQWANSVQLDVKAALAPIMQAADVLAMNKTALLDAATRADVCPELLPNQLHRLLTLYAPDDYDPDAVHPGVLKQVAALVKDATRPLHRRAQLRRFDARHGRRRFDLGLAALRTPRSLLQRPGFAFLGATAVAAAAAVASASADDADEPW